MPADFRFAICNEIFGQTPLSEACEQAREIGFEGMELAPHTLAEDATLLTHSDKRELRSQIEDAGLAFVGLHWLLASPPGLHITSADPAVSGRTWDYVHRAIDFCADLGGGVIVIGSPKQRSTNGSM